MFEEDHAINVHGLYNVMRKLDENNKNLYYSCNVAIKDNQFQITLAFAMQIKVLDLGVPYFS